MRFLYQKVIFHLLLNAILFIMVMVGVQNSDNKIKVNFFINETINLPVGFILGSSFICGSIAGSVLNLLYHTKKK